MNDDNIVLQQLSRVLIMLLSDEWRRLMGMSGRWIRITYHACMHWYWFPIITQLGYHLTDALTVSTPQVIEFQSLFSIEKSWNSRGLERMLRIVSLILTQLQESSEIGTILSAALPTLCKVLRTFWKFFNGNLHGLMH